MRTIFVVIAFLMIPSLSMAMDLFEGSWSYDVPGEDGITSVWISRQGNTYVGEVEGGSRHGRIYSSKLKGWVEGERLYARICSEPDDADDDVAKKEMQECLEKSGNLAYFTSNEKELNWYEKKGSTWRLVVTLKAPNKARKAKKSAAAQSPDFPARTDPQADR